jgi:copper resistance protein D
VIDPLILVRAAHFTATALAAGTASFVVLAAEPSFRVAGAGVEGTTFQKSARWLVWSGLAAAIGTGIIWLMWLASDIYGTSLVNVCLHGGAWSVLTETRFGLVCIARLALAALLGVLMLWPAGRWLQLIVAGVLIGSLGFIGHAGATPSTAGEIHLASDVLHLLAAAAWVGALSALALLLHQMRREKNDRAGIVTRTAARRFSTAGIASVATLIATGLVNSWNLLSGPRDLIATEYGQILSLKLGLFAAMLGIAAVNRYGLTPRLAATSAMRALERNSLAEVGLGICVFLFVGALGTMAPPVHDHVHIPTEQIPADAAFVHIHSTEAMADVTIEPGRAGPAQAKILLMHEDFSILTAKALTFVLIPQASATVAPITRSATRRPDGTWQVDGLEIGQPGVWTVKLSIDVGGGSPIAIDAPVVIER